MKRRKTKKGKQKYEKGKIQQTGKNKMEKKIEQMKIRKI